jgi:hypothetical protein
MEMGLSLQFAMRRNPGSLVKARTPGFVGNHDISPATFLEIFCLSAGWLDRMERLRR